jgi:hypothetical protein
MVRRLIQRAGDSMNNRDVRAVVGGALLYGGIQLAGRLVSNLTGDQTVQEIADYSTNILAPIVAAGYTSSNIQPRNPNPAIAPPADQGGNAEHEARTTTMVGLTALAGYLVADTIGDYSGSINALNSVTNTTNSITDNNTGLVGAVLGAITPYTTRWFNQGRIRNIPADPLGP